MSEHWKQLANFKFFGESAVYNRMADTTADDLVLLDAKCFLTSNANKGNFSIDIMSAIIVM